MGLSKRLSRRSLLLTVVACAAVPTMSFRARAAQGYGRFEGRIATEWLPDGRNMRLLEPFEYIGPDDRRWPVPPGTVVDGASIPRVFWSVIGGPFEGPYRGPSVIHDFYCQTRTRKYQDVHQTFHDAMLCAGVTTSRAWFMYEGVARFGPKWSNPKIDPRCEIVDEHYDFARCARNAAPPALEMASPTKSELMQFSRDVASQADPDDVRKLQEAIKRLSE
jgi:hypothetical protein